MKLNDKKLLKFIIVHNYVVYFFVTSYSRIYSYLTAENSCNMKFTYAVVLNDKSFFSMYIDCLLTNSSDNN